MNLPAGPTPAARSWGAGPCVLHLIKDLHRADVVAKPTIFTPRRDTLQQIKAGAPWWSVELCYAYVFWLLSSLV